MDLDAIDQLSDDDARTCIEQIRWPHGPVCSHCGGSDVTRLQGGSTRSGLFKCRNKTCRKQFTVTTGTVLADTHLSIKTWLQVVCLMCSSRGISAHALHRRCNIRTYKTARHVCERIRYAKQQPPLAEMLAQAREAEGLDDFTLPPGADRDVPVLRRADPKEQTKETKAPRSYGTTLTLPAQLRRRPAWLVAGPAHGMPADDSQTDKDKDAAFDETTAEAEAPKMAWPAGQLKHSICASVSASGQANGNLSVIAQGSGEHGLDHVPVHVGEAALGAVVVVGQPLVIEAEEVQDRGVEVVERGLVLRRPSSRARRSLRKLNGALTPAPISQQVKPSML